MILFLLLASKFHATVYVSSDGTDAESCGTLLAPCKTVQYALNSKASDIEILTTSKTFTSYSTDHIAASITSSVTISGTPTLTFEQKKTCFTVSGTSVEVEITRVSAKVTSNSQYLTTSATGEVYLEYLHIYSTGSVVLSSSLISATAGELYIDEVKISRFTLTNAPLIQAASTSYLDIDDSSFVHITRNTGDGAVVSYTIDAYSPRIRGYYSQCKCKDGNGGAIALTINKGTGDDEIYPVYNAEFDGCSASKSGGAVYILSHRDAVVDLSDVDAYLSPCSAGVDGGLIYVETDASTIFRMKPEETYGHSAGRDGGLIAAVFNGEGGYLELSSSSYARTNDYYDSASFESMSAKRNGGVISVVGGATHTATTLLKIGYYVSIEGCTAGENGGGISYIQKGKGGIEIDVSTSVDHCTASKYGGGMYLDIQGETTILFDAGFTFVNNTAQTGASVYLNTNQDALATSDAWRELVDGSLVRTNVSEYSGSVEPILFLSSEVLNTFVIAGSTSTTMDQIGAVSITGKDPTTGQTCPTNTCKTLSDYLAESPSTDYSYNRVQYSSTGTFKEEGALTFASQKLVISGYGTDQKTVLTLSSGTVYDIETFVLFKYLGFTVSTGDATKPITESFYVSHYAHLNFFHCSVSAEQQSAQLSSGLIKLDDGNLNIVSSSFTGMTFANDVLIKAQYSTDTYLCFSTFTNIESKNTDESAGGSVYSSSFIYSGLTCIGSTFKSCKSASNGGAIKAVTLSLGDYYAESDKTAVTFDGCTSERNGGALYIDLESMFHTYHTLDDCQVKFTSTTAKQSGSYIYARVNSEYYTTFTTYANWTYFKPTATNQFMVASTESSTAATDYFNLLVTSVTVSQTGDDDSDTCGGKSAKPCATIYGALGSYDGTASEIKVEAGANITETEYILITEPITISGSSTNTPTITVEFDKSYFDIDSSTTFTSLKFVVSGTSSYAHALFSYYPAYYEKADLTLDSLTITSKNPASLLDYAIVSVGYPLTIKNCVFANFTLAYSSLISIPSDVFVCSGNTFTNIVRQSGSGAVFEEEVGYEGCGTVSLSNCKFDQCKCLAGHGGAISFEAYEEGRLSLSHLTFTNCEAHLSPSVLADYDYDTLANATDTDAADVACGGGMAVQLVGEPASFSFSDMSFSGCKAKYGSQMAAYTTDETLEGVLYSEELWEGLLSDDTADNEFVLAVIDGAFSNSENPVVFKSTKQVSDVAPPDSGSSTVIIIVVVVVVVVVIVVVAVIIVCILRSKQKACFAPKNESSADKQANESEMTNETPKEQTKVEVPPDDVKPPADQ